MSFRSLLTHRCHLYDLVSSDNDGSPVTTYQRITTTPIPCRLDLSFIRQGKDMMWIEATARPDDRTGVMFFLLNAPIRAGVRVEIVRGPSGIFQIQGAIDEAWDFNSPSHYECGVLEVSTLQMRAPLVQNRDDSNG